MIFVHVDVDVGEHVNILEYVGVAAENTPTFLIHEMEKSAKFFPSSKESRPEYKITNKYNSEEMSSFINFAASRFS
jgi:hypothetical protein